MSARRGVLIVLEGCDRAGKSTQCKNLVQSLLDKNIPAELISFPDRSTPTGKIINSYLNNKEELSDKAIHLLFSANRWELEPRIVQALNSGITLIVDRYAYSGVAFSAAKQGMDLDWCSRPEVGLPKPDLVFFLNLSPDAMESRGDFGKERYENSEFQKKVLNNFIALKDHSWVTVNADQDIESLHQELLKLVLIKVEENKSSPLSKLW